MPVSRAIALMLSSRAARMRLAEASRVLVDISAIDGVGADDAESAGR